MWSCRAYKFNDSQNFSSYECSSISLKKPVQKPKSVCVSETNVNGPMAVFHRNVFRSLPFHLPLRYNMDMSPNGISCRCLGIFSGYHADGQDAPFKIKNKKKKGRTKKVFQFPVAKVEEDRVGSKFFFLDLKILAMANYSVTTRCWKTSVAHPFQIILLSCVSVTGRSRLKSCWHTCMSQ